MASSPKAPKPTAEETYLQRRQVQELTKLDDQANTRIKRLKRDAYNAPMGAKADAQASARRSTPADDKLGVTIRGGGMAAGVSRVQLGIVNDQAARSSQARAAGAPAATGSASVAGRPTRFRGKVATR